MRGRRGAEPRGDGRLKLRYLARLLVNAAFTLSLAGAVMLAAGLVILLTIQELRTPAQVLVLLGLLLLAVPVVTHFSEVSRAATARTGRYTVNTLIMVASLLAILVLAGFVSFENAYRIDLTATRRFTLAPQTKKVLDEMAEPVKVRGYFDPEDARQEIIKRRADDFFHEFSRRNRKFDYEFIDPDLKPSLARQDGVTEYPTMVFTAPESQRNPHLLTPIFYSDAFVLSEQDLVSALLIITGTEQKTVYFVTGHKERDIEDAEKESLGFGFVRSGLLGDNYRVRTLNLKAADKIPEDAAVLVIAGPEGGFLKDERAVVEAYLRDGGSLLALVDDSSKSDINKLLNTYGVDVMPGAIVDMASSPTGDPRSVIVRRSQYDPDHPITKPLDDTFFTQVAAIKDIIKRAPEDLPPNPDEQNIKLTPLALTSLLSCVTTDPDRSDCSGEDDQMGPHNVALAIEALAPVGEDPVQINPTEDIRPASIVVIGDSDFATNRFYYAFTNSDLFLNAVDWLAQHYDLISIRAKPQAFRQLIITQRQFNFIRYSSWFLMPTSVLLLAGIAWWRRR